MPVYVGPTAAKRGCRHELTKDMLLLTELLTCCLSPFVEVGVKGARLQAQKEIRKCASGGGGGVGVVGGGGYLSTFKYKGKLCACSCQKQTFVPFVGIGV